MLENWDVGECRVFMEVILSELRALRMGVIPAIDAHHHFWDYEDTIALAKMIEACGASVSLGNRERGVRC